MDPLSKWPITTNKLFNASSGSVETHQFPTWVASALTNIKHLEVYKWFALVYDTLSYFLFLFSNFSLEDLVPFFQN